VIGGGELRRLREGKGLSRRELAALAGIHPDSVKYWERRDRLDLRGHAPARMLRALGAEYLLRAGQPGGHRRGDFRALNARARTWGLTSLPKPKPAARVRCEAQTRRGTPCRRMSEPGRRRCRLHGGCSTGPLTPEGRARIAEAQRRRWARWRAQRDRLPERAASATSR